MANYLFPDCRVISGHLEVGVLAGAAFLEPSSVQKVRTYSAPDPAEPNRCSAQPWSWQVFEASVMSVVGQVLQGEAGYCPHSATCSIDEGRLRTRSRPSRVEGKGADQVISGPPCDLHGSGLLAASCPSLPQRSSCLLTGSLCFLRCLFTHFPLSRLHSLPTSFLRPRTHTERSTRVPAVKEGSCEQKTPGFRTP